MSWSSRSMPSRWRLGARSRERGSATVLVLGVAVSGVVALVGALGLAQAVVLSHRAAAAADLAALAAAQATSSGTEPGCVAASRVATSNGASLDGCEDGPGGQVTVWATATSAGPWAWRVVARSRAGPADAGR